MSVPYTGPSGLSCRDCETQNAWNRRFCRSCGAILTRSCRLCLFGNGWSDHFCGGCGTAVGAQSAVEDDIQPEQAASGDEPSTLGPLARSLTKINQDSVQARRVQPLPQAGGEDDEVGQDQIDALFG